MDAKPKLRMPIRNERLVELHCYMPMGGFLAPLCYNLLLLFMCAIYGFLTRKLPENFNESWYIFVSVSTTSFLWLVFLPTYFTTFRTYHQAALLGLCLILNASVTLLCLFVPKVYAIYYVDDEKLQIKGSGTASSQHGKPTLSVGVTKSTKVTPLSVS